MARSKKQQSDEEEVPRAARVGSVQVLSRRQQAQKELAEVNDLNALSTEQLNDYVTQMRITVVGTGANGRVLKSDLISALDGVRGGSGATTTVEPIRETTTEE